MLPLASDTSIAQDTDIHTNLRVQCGLEQWTTDTKGASRGSIDHKGLSKRTNPENKLFFILDILSMLRTRVITQLGSMFGG